jgi:hypothetical protein
VKNQQSGQPVLEGSYLTRDSDKWDPSLQRYVYNYKLRVFIGQPQAYSSKLIDFNVKLTEPCIGTNVNSQTIGSTFNIVIGGGNLNIPFQPFTDSVSFLYGTGNGYDICSPQTYSIKTL